MTLADEFHHAAANSYKNILDYFSSKFMLGLTATPYRMDNKDIYELCDINVIYEIDFKNAINRDLLVPFKYYGIYDETNYDDIEFTNGKYNIKQALGFCSSIKQLEIMHLHVHIIPRYKGDVEKPKGGIRNFKTPLVEY